MLLSFPCEVGGRKINIDEIPPKPLLFCGSLGYDGLFLWGYIGSFLAVISSSL
jgi:hypothetical protein